MDTLPHDLINLITKHIRASDCFLLSIQTLDNQPYLNLITVKARLKLALKENNSGWIHQALNFINDNFTYIDEFVIALSTKYDLDLGLNFVEIGEKDYNSCYILGKKGDDSNVNWLGDAYITSAFVKGLSKGQHHKLFDRYATTFCLVSDHIMNFKDEDYIISTIKRRFLTFLLPDRRNYNLIFNIALQNNKFKVIQYLLDNHMGMLDDRLIPYLIHTGRYQNEKFNNKCVLKLSIYQACIDSNIGALNYIYEKSKNTAFAKILSTCLITKELHQYAYDNFDIKVDLNQELVDIIAQLREHIDGYKYFYNHLDIARNSNSFLEFIIFVLIGHYINKNDMKNFKIIYRIGVLFNILYDDRILRAIRTPFYYNAMFLLTDAIYQKSKMPELKAKAKQMGIKNYSRMKKSELILVLIDGCC